MADTTFSFSIKFLALFALLFASIEGTVAFHHTLPKVSLDKFQISERNHAYFGIGRRAAVGRHKAPQRKSRMNMVPIEEIGSVVSGTHELLSFLPNTREEAEAIAGPFFGLSLFPYLTFLYFLNVEENECPKGVTIGFATCLLFVFLTIPAAIISQVDFGVSLADCDWLHGSAESLLTVTNLVTVIAFRQALNSKERGDYNTNPPISATSYEPMINLVVALTALAGVTAVVPALMGASVHTPYLGGFMDFPKEMIQNLGFAHAEPENALTVACWIIHWSSLVEFLVAMGFAWRWADVVGNKKWKGITWGLIPLHSSGITACTYHLFYNSIPVLVPLQAFLTCVGNTTAAWAAYRLAISNGWKIPYDKLPSFLSTAIKENESALIGTANIPEETLPSAESSSLVGFEDLGDALADDNDFTFLVKLFAGCAVASYAIKYGELALDFPFVENNVWLGVSFVMVPSALNAFKWYKRTQDPTFEGWF